MILLVGIVLVMLFVLAVWVAQGGDEQ